MKQYFLNLWLWLRGFAWLWTRQFNQLTAVYPPGQGPWNTISYKPGWSPLRFWPIYLLDYGLCVLLGRGVQSLSRAFKLFGGEHWAHTGPLLWGSIDLWVSSSSSAAVK